MIHPRDEDFHSVEPSGACIVRTVCASFDMACGGRAAACCGVLRLALRWFGRELAAALRHGEVAAGSDDVEAWIAAFDRAHVDALQAELERFDLANVKSHAASEKAAREPGVESVCQLMTIHMTDAAAKGSGLKTRCWRSTLDLKICRRARTQCRA
ncbi:hypothetical protein VOM14_29815 [Paraburkholderia sp. MPAMCS5]|uniref:hypothetical protein n=1 Tax=Paraburkholderia sp. MPAMCS5 TaxID=3112563 RepID=UPI002E19902A|nr:hypothetical protein [Paraburkholderia sp. MPAMCS5]